MQSARENKRDGVTLCRPIFPLFTFYFDDGDPSFILFLFILPLFSFLFLLLFDFQPFLLALFPQLFLFLLQF